MNTATERQREHYTQTSGRMADLSTIEIEHNHALSWLAGLALQYGWRRFLDVGAGSGRGMVHLKKYLPLGIVIGVEPVDALRAEGYKGGLKKSELLAGDAHDLQFNDGDFDVVYATGVLHHTPKPKRAIEEMIRVASCAVLISDMNNYGCGPTPQKMLAHALRLFGLWKIFQWIKNGGRYDKYSDGDGVFYSYSLFDELPWLRKRGYQTYLLTTRGTQGRPLWDATHVALLILK